MSHDTKTSLETEQNHEEPVAASNDSAQNNFSDVSETVDNVINLHDAAASNHQSGDAAETKAVDPSAEWKSKVAYLTAEIDNMRKRFARERQDVLKFANEDLIQKFLPVLDCLELALKAAKDSESKLEQSVRDNPMLQSLIKGLEMTLKVFEQILESNGCTPVKGVGESFDPSQHEALGQTQDLNFANDKVSGVMQRGFYLAGRVIRTAKVLVNKINN